MLHLKRTLVLTLTLLVFAAALSFSSAAQTSTALFRFVHVVPGLTAIDIYVNDSLSVESLDYGEASVYIAVPSGTQTVRVTLAGLTTTLFEQSFNAAAGDTSTLVASSADPLAFVEYGDDVTSMTLQETRFSIINAIEDSPDLDLQVAGPNIETTTLTFGLGYQGTFGPSQPPPDTYTFAAIPTAGGDPVVEETVLDLNAATVNTLVFYGVANAAEVLLLTAPAQPEGEVGFVRFAHGVSDAPSVDLTLDGVKAVSSLAYGEASEHLAVPAGDYEVGLQVAGSGTDILSTTITVQAGSAVTVVPLGSADAISVETLVDDISAVDPRTAVVSIINTLGDSTGFNLTLADGTVVTENAALNPPLAGAIAGEVAFGEGRAILDYPETLFYGGVYYNIFVLQNDEGVTLSIADTRLSTGINSAPSAEEIVVDASTETTTEATTAPEAPPAPTQAAAAATEAPVATAAPVVDEDQPPTARILLDPGVNLQLRLYPSSEALSLGLSPSGSTVTVNGRVGAPVDIEGNEILLDDGTEFVDPAEGLTENEDLEAAETWLNITFETGDGGSINAWVNALYLEVRAPDGDLQRLANLAMIPQNRPGEVVGTSVTPPPVVEDVVYAYVFNLDPGVSLNIRRLPTVDGEVLARAVTGTRLDFLGIGQSGEWVFVGYSPEEGGRITGWASATYIRYEFRNAAIDLEEMEERELLLTADEEVERGEISADAPPLVQPTVDPFEDAYVATVELDPGANLNLRRLPSVDGEVLASIPSNDRVVILTRNADSTWLEVTFDGVNGWIASNFVTVRFNGQLVDLDGIPINTDLESDTNEDTAGEDNSEG